MGSDNHLLIETGPAVPGKGKTMSAYVMSLENLKSLVESFAAVAALPVVERVKIMNTLHAENVKSVNFRYNETAAPELITAPLYESLQSETLTGHAAFDKCEGLIYQSCEHDTYRASKALALTLRMAAACLSGIDEPDAAARTVQAYYAKHSGHLIMEAGRRSVEMVGGARHYSGLSMMPITGYLQTVAIGTDGPYTSEKSITAQGGELGRESWHTFSPAQISRLVDDAGQVAEKRRADAERERNEEARALELFREQVRPLIKAEHVAAIVATYDISVCDLHTDYFATTTGRQILLAFSTHTRQLFPEMRKAIKAAGVDDADLIALADDADAEQRDAGYRCNGRQMKAGGTYSTGWRVHKVKFYKSDKAAAFGAGMEIAPGLLSNGNNTPPDGKKKKPETAPGSDHAPTSENAPAMRIEQHTHTKKGFEMFVCVMADRIDRAEFDALLDKARESGGWYSRAWGTTPGGFAFKERAKAEAFAACGPVVKDVQGKKVEEIPSAPEPKKQAASVTAEQLRNQAARLHKNAAACFVDRLTNTPKRLAQAMHKRLEGTRDERTARALERLADNLDAGEPMPAWLTGQKAPQVRATLAGLLRYKLEPCRNGYHGYSVETSTPEHDCPEARAAFALLDDAKETARRAESDLKQKIEALRFSRIPGYFPTPAPVVARMLERVEGIPSRILEPSAGSGNIADALRDAYPSVPLDCIETNHSLREILAAKGHALAGSDFMALERGDGDYDLIVMNPPFENLQDAAHVMHAFELLAPGGELVAIVSPSVFSRDDGKAYRFRQLFESVNGTREPLPSGSFKQSGTGVDTVLICMRKPL